MRSLNYSHIFLAAACVMLLGGCESMGTSSAGYTADEDAYHPATTSSPASSRSMAAGTALFENQSGSQLYGASPFPPGPLPGDSDATSSNFDNLEIVSPALKGKLAVMRVGSERNDSNLLSVFAGLKNKSGHRLPLEVETVYKDKGDRPLSPDNANWVPITLQPHEETQYRSVAISEDATDFVVRVRRASENAQP